MKTNLFRNISRRVVLTAVSAVAVLAFLSASCEGNITPIDITTTTFDYIMSIDDVHLGKELAECFIQLDAGTRKAEKVTLDYKIDNDLSLRLSMNGSVVRPGSSVTFDMVGQMRLTLPELKEGRHNLHITLTNQYDKSVTRDLPFTVIRDKVPATGLQAPLSLRLEKGASMDTTVVVVPEDADDLAVTAASQNENVVRVSVSGSGPKKALHLEGVTEGSAKVTLRHADISTPAVIAVDVFTYSMTGLGDFSLTEEASETVALTVSPFAEAELIPSNGYVTVTKEGANTWTVKAVKVGTTVLTARLGSLSQTAIVTVMPKPENITVTPMSATIAPGATKVFSVSSSGGFRVEVDSDCATVVEQTETAVTIRNDNGGFTDVHTMMSVINRVDPTKRAVSNLRLEKKQETVTLTESSTEPGKCVWTVGGTNGGWTLTSFPSGTNAKVYGNDIIMINAGFSAIKGRLAVKTSAQGVEVSKDVTVKGLDVSLRELSLSPTTFSVEVGGSFSITATAKYSDNSTRDVTSSVTWSQSSNLRRSSGSFTAQSEGAAWVAATMEGITVRVEGKVNPKPVTLKSVSLDPTSFNAYVNENKVFTLTATFSDGSTKDVAQDASWSVTGPAKMTSKGYFTMTGAGEVLITVKYVYGSAERTLRAKGTVTKPTAEVTKVTIDPMRKTIKVGDDITFKGTVYYSDGTQDENGTFTVSPANLLAGGAGTYVAVASGTATVKFSAGKMSATSVVTIERDGEPEIKSIVLSTKTLTLAIDAAEKVYATAVLDDGTTKDITDAAMWASSNSTVATVSKGTIRGVAAGTATITVTHQGKSASCSVTVLKGVELSSLTMSTKSMTLNPGMTSSITVIAGYSDGTMSNVTASAIWTTSNQMVATVEAGQVKAVGIGSATVNASYGGKMATCTVTVTAEVKVSAVVISPVSLSMKTTDAPKALKASAQYSDGKSSDVTYTGSWSSTNTAVATVSSAGVVTPVGKGSAEIHCAFSGVTGVCSVIVTEVAVEPKSMTMNTTSKTMNIGDRFDLSATVTFSDGSRSSQNGAYTWTVDELSGMNVVSVSGGTVTALSAGKAVVTASYTQNAITVSARCTVTVNAAPVTLSSVSVSPRSLTMAAGTTYSLPGEFSVTAYFSDGHDEDVTSKASWSIDGGSSYAEMSGRTIRAKQKTYSPVSVKASYTYSGVTKSDSFSLNVSEAVSVKKVTVEPSELALTVGGTWDRTGAIVWVEYTDGKTKSIANGDAEWSSVQWSVANSGVAYFNGNTLVAKGSGSTTIYANYSGVRGEISLKVSAEIVLSYLKLSKEKLEGLSIHESYSLPKYVRVDAYLSDGSHYDVTNDVTWSSDDRSVATVSGSVLQPVKSGGSTTVKASYTRNGVTKTASLSIVIDVAVERISMSSTMSVAKNATNTLYVTISPNNAVNKKIDWNVDSGSEFISITPQDNGARCVVTGLAVGSARVTAKAQDGGASASCAITVVAESVPVSKVTITDADLVGDRAVTMDGKSFGPFNVKVEPKNATNKTVTWSSSNSRVVLIDEDTGVMKAMGEGTCTITATSESNPDVSDSKNVEVKKMTYGIRIIQGSDHMEWEWNETNRKEVVLELTNVSISRSTVKFYRPGTSDIVDNVFTVTYSTATGKDVLTFMPSENNTTFNDKVVEARVVDDSGLIKPEDALVITLTHKAKEQSRVESISVTAKDGTGNVQMNTGDKMSAYDLLNVSILNQYGEKMTDVTPSWKVEGSGVISVSGDEITALAQGTGKIWAEVGGKSSSKVTVTVKDVDASSVQLRGVPAEMFKGDVANDITVSVTPSNAAVGKITVRSVNPSVIKINGDKESVNGLSNGDKVSLKAVGALATGAEIEVSASGKTQKYKIPVYDQVEKLVITDPDNNNSTLSNGSGLYVEQGQYHDIIVEIKPESVKDPSINVSFGAYSEKVDEFIENVEISSYGARNKFLVRIFTKTLSRPTSLGASVLFISSNERPDIKMDLFVSNFSSSKLEMVGLTDQNRVIALNPGEIRSIPSNIKIKFTIDDESILFNYDDEHITWELGDNSVAVVKNNKYIEGRKAGSTTLRPRLYISKYELKDSIWGKIGVWLSFNFDFFSEYVSDSYYVSTNEYIRVEVNQ